MLFLVPALIRRPLPTLARLAKKHGRLLTFDAGKYQQIHVVSDPEVVKHLLKTNAANYLRSPVIQSLKGLLGDGIFISEADQWKRQHELLKPVLHDQLTQQFFDVVDGEIQKLVEAWRADGTVDLEAGIEKMMLRILIRGVFGVEMQLDEARIIRNHQAVLRHAGIEQQKIRYFKKKLFGKYVGGDSDGPADALAYLHDVAEQIRQVSEANATFLYKYLTAKNPDAKTVREMILNLLFAGYDTTASALSWTLHLLGNHPEWQEKIRDEFSAGSNIHLKMVLQEALRLYPPVWSVHRKSVEDDMIGNWKLEAGSYLMIDIYSLHRHPAIWQHPDAFYPEHFNPENTKGKTFAFIPFGQGQRMCIGKPMAMQELEFIVPRILSQMKLTSTNHNPDIRPDIIVKSKNGLFVKVESR